MVGSIVVAGTVVVYVTCAPSAVAGIALPTPALVNCVGRVSVAVLGLEGESGEPYMLPGVPLARV